MPAPGKLTMSKHSTDSILLHWTAAVGISGATLMGYRVYVNGLEEGMVRLLVCVCFFESPNDKLFHTS